MTRIHLLITIALAANVALSTAADESELLFHVDFDDAPLGAPPAFPDGEPEYDALAYGPADYRIVADPSDPENHWLEGVSFIREDSVIALADPTFGASDAPSGAFAIAWSSAVGPDTSATISLSNGDSTSLFVNYHGPSGSIRVNDADGRAVAPPAAPLFSPERPQRFSLLVDFADETYDLSIDGALVGEQLPIIDGADKGLTDLEFRFRTDQASLSQPRFGIGLGSGLPVGLIRIEDISIAEIETTRTIEARFDLIPSANRLFARGKGHGSLPVVIFGSAELDVAQIDISSLQLNGLVVKTRPGKPLAKTMDFGSPAGPADGYPDLLCAFEFDAPTLTANDPTIHLLSGFLANGDLLAGSQSHAADDRPLRNRKNRQ